MRRHKNVPNKCQFSSRSRKDKVCGEPSWDAQSSPAKPEQLEGTARLTDFLNDSWKESRTTLSEAFSPSITEFFAVFSTLLIGNFMKISFRLYCFIIGFVRIGQSELPSGVTQVSCRYRSCCRAHFPSFFVEQRQLSIESALCGACNVLHNSSLLRPCYIDLISVACRQSIRDFWESLRGPLPPVSPKLGNSAPGLGLS